MTGGREDSQQRRRRGRRGPRRATPAYLEKAAAYYLERYAASAAHLRRILMNKVRRSAQAHGTCESQGAAAIDGIIARLTAIGLLDDRAYATARARSLARRGSSARAIRSRLSQRGLQRDLVEAAIEALSDEAAAPELLSALTFARRRRLGPFRPENERAPRRDKDLAALGRQGFALETARQVIDATDPDALLAEATGQPS